MNRMEWNFGYAVAAICDAAKEKVKHHTERLTWWRVKKDEVLFAIKDNGMVVEESLAPSNMSTAYNRGSTVMVRDDLARDLQECTQKIREHDAWLKEYSGWVQVLEAQAPTRYLDLHHADWLYFFGK